jgi:esterase
MKLEYQTHGSGPVPVVILHGLLGSGQNWRSIAGRLAGSIRTIYLPDARNHGTSPHDTRHDYDLMASDLLEFLSDQGLASAHLVGHSVGAMGVMLAACRSPERVLSMVSVDFAPRAYNSSNRPVLDAMAAIDLSLCRTRQEVFQQLDASLNNRILTMFVMTNLRQNSDGGLEWRVNLPVLRRFTDSMADFEMPTSCRYPGPALFLTGGNSD